MCVYNSTTRMRSLDLQWNIHRIRALHLELPLGAPSPMVTFRYAYRPKI